MAHLLEVKNLKTHFPTRAGLVRAVDEVSFYIDRGELLGALLAASFLVTGTATWSSPAAPSRWVWV